VGFDLAALDLGLPTSPGAIMDYLQQSIGALPSWWPLAALGGVVLLFGVLRTVLAKVVEAALLVGLVIVVEVIYHNVWLEG